MLSFNPLCCTSQVPTLAEADIYHGAYLHLEASAHVMEAGQADSTLDTQQDIDS